MTAVDLYVCVSVCVGHRIPTLLHEPGYNLGEWYSRCLTTIGGFAIGARVSLLWQHSAEREMLASACTRSMPGAYFVAEAQYKLWDDDDDVMI